MYKYIFLVLGLLGLFPANAQENITDANIVGDVQCKGEHLPYITISIDGTTIGTATDATGHYRLTNLPIGTFTLRASGVGYRSSEFNITTERNTTKEVKFTITEDVLNIEGVVITADRNQSNRADAPVIVKSVQPRLLEITQSANIAEGLCFTPGVRTECNCQNCGFTQLRMNGLDGPYTQILMNSRPVFSGLAGVYGLELIPTNMVERIEIVRGGGSALFGGNAIAGTVNIITKDPVRNTFNFDSRLGITGIGGYSGTKPALDRQVNLNTSVISDDRKTGAYIYAMMRNRDPYDENGDAFSEAVLLENSTFGFNVFHKPGKNSKISLDAYRIDEFRRGGNKFDYLPHETEITEQVEHLITGGNLAFDLFTNDNYDKLTVYAAAQHVDRDSYYGSLMNQQAYGYTADLTTSIGAQYVINKEKFLFAPSKTIMGIDNTNNDLNDNKLGALGQSNTSLIRQFVNTLGTFIQQDWKSNKFNLSLGLRFDNYLIRDQQADQSHAAPDIRKSVVVPRMNLLYKINQDTRVRIGYATGYRAPQVFNEDLHIELINAKTVTHLNDPDLIQETSHTFSSSIDHNFNFGATIHEILIEGFYTRLENPFADQFYPLDDQGNFAYQRINAYDGAYVTGVNFELNSYISEKINSQFGFTVQRSRYETAQAWGEGAQSSSASFMRSPDQYGFATIIFEPLQDLNAAISLNYTGSMLVPHFGGQLTGQTELAEILTDMTLIKNAIENSSSINEITQLSENLAGLQKNYFIATEMNNAIENGDIIIGERLERSENFLIIDLLLSYEFHLSKQSHLECYIGMKNVLNQTQKIHDSGMFRDAGYIYGPCQPRTLNIGLKVWN